MKKIALLNTPVNTEGDSRRFQCLGIGSLAAMIRSRGYICDIIDGELPSNHRVDEIIKKLITYDIIGLSVTTPAFQTAVLIACAVKSIANIPIFLGGHHATFQHQSIIEQFDCFDAIIRGEGESYIVALCEDYFEHNSFTNPLDHVSYRNIDGHIRLASKIAIEDDLDCLPFPVRDRFDEYRMNNAQVVTISSSRGCPYGCSFCSATSFRNSWLGRSPEKIAQEVFSIYQTTNDFKISFVDDNFYMNPERSIQILMEIKKLCKRNFNFLFATRADQILNNGKEYIRLLKEFGCIEIEMGVENGSTSVLKRYNKNISPVQSKLAIQMIEAYDINVAVDYVLFDPEITKSELKENIQFLKDAKLWGYEAPLIYARVIAFPGTSFTKKHPHLYNESCYYPSDLYFEDEQVCEIYKCLQSFRLQHQRKITAVLSAMRTILTTDKELEVYKKDYAWLKLLPYLLLEELVNCKSGHKKRFEMFTKANKIAERLQQYQDQWLSVH